MKIKDIVNRDLVNLKNCDQEPIHVPGSIQPHGFLIAIDKDEFEIQFCSGNLENFIGLTHLQLLGKNISEIFGDKISSELKPLLSITSGNTKTFKLDFSGKQFEFVCHANEKNIIIESDSSLLSEEQSEDLFELSKQFLGYMEDTNTLIQLCGLVAGGIKKVTGYDRVMIYRFDKDYNGEVIAESKRDDLEPFLGLHYPHTDIPAQARELYIKNLLRIIPDIGYTPEPLYTIDDGASKTLDLSYSVLRSVSPIHVQYLQNMGVGATLTISLIHKKKLWGLVACHHYSKKYLSHEVRLAAKLQGHFITSQIDVRQLNEEYEVSRAVNQAAEEIISKKFDLNRQSFNSIISSENILKLCNANGVSIVFDGMVYKSGNTPKDQDIKKLSTYLSAYTDNGQFKTEEIKKLSDDFSNHFDTIPGVNYFSLTKFSDDSIIWYRNETINEVSWAGDPSKAIEKDKNGLSPRKSFELWSQTVKGTSKPWLESELNAASNFASVLQKHINAILLSEEEEKQRQLAEKLRETNAELENINWISTHDLQEPLRKIQVMSSYILEDEDTNLPDDFIEKVLRMNKSAERMQMLITDILKYTRLKQNDDAFEQVDLNALLNDVKSEVKEQLQAKNGSVSTDKLPVITAIPFLLKQLLFNLVYNSIKFSSPERPLKINFSVQSVSEKVNDQVNDFYKIVYSDNGIGFSPDHNESIFNIFSRLHTADKYSGSGIGLALCKKIMKTHNGSITASGIADKGATFILHFPKSRIS